MNRVLILLALLAPLGVAQTPQFTISYVLADGVPHPLANSIAFPPADINQTSTATVYVLNEGTGPGNLNGISVTGSAFRITGAPPLLAPIAAGSYLSFSIVFAPTQPGTFNGTFSINLSGAAASAALSGSTPPSSVSLAYIDPNTNNVLGLSDGSALSFPDTAVGAAATLTLVIANTGSGTGIINAIALNGSTGSVFQLANVPAVPATVAPAQQLRFGILFSPQKQQTFSASLAVTVNGKLLNINLQARGIGPLFTYAYGPGSAAAVPGGAVTLADTPVGQTLNIPFSVTNSGASDGQITAISVSGAGLSLSNLPPVPFTLHPGDSQNFTLTFAPAQPGPVSGRLIIGNDSFTLNGNAIGSQLIFTFSSGSAAISVANGGSVIFSPLAVGGTESLNFTIHNTGTTTATVSSIALADANTTFALPQLPALPLSLATGATVSFPVSFAPGSTGSLTATLRVDGNSFVLSGAGTQPPSLPAYQFQLTPTAPQPAQQPQLSLTLAAPYPLPMTGTLTLSFISSVFADDPSIQFASGGRSVAFSIPANTTQALFNGSPSIPMQTGTTAGSIVVTPSFVLRTGYNLTPASLDTLNLTIPQMVPQFQTATIVSETLTSFSLVLSGYSTTRGLTQIAIDIAGKPGSSFASSHLAIDVSAGAASWYRSTNSANTGGAFLVSIPFNLQNGSTGDDLVHLIQSLSVTATNGIGVSNAVKAVP
jgi:hypothetical protein